MKAIKNRELGLKIFLSSILFLFFLFPPIFSYAQEKQEKGEIKQVIFNKEYRVEKGTKEGKAGYWCYWGKDKAWWEPKPWYLKEHNEQGPAFYDRWVKPGLTFPWDDDLIRREKYSGYQWALRGINLASGLQFMDDYCDEGEALLIYPTGRVRSKKYYEWNIAYLKSQHNGRWPKEEGQRTRSYAFEYISPEDVSGLGMIIHSYSGKKDDDNFYYSPAVRKVRRMSTGNRQDFFPGTCFRYEDISLTKPIHEYKILRRELSKDRGPDIWGFGDTEYGGRKFEREVKRFDGIGNPSVVVEVTLPEGWYCAKQIRWYDVKTTFCNYELTYDKKGRLIRTFVPTMTLHHPETYPLYVTWCGWWIHDLLTGYKNVWPVTEFMVEPGVPESTFNERFLLKEVSRLLWWR